jgi:hypothetical protein
MGAGSGGGYFGDFFDESPTFEIAFQRGKENGFVLVELGGKKREGRFGLRTYQYRWVRHCFVHL